MLILACVAGIYFVLFQCKSLPFRMNTAFEVGLFHPIYNPDEAFCNKFTPPIVSINGVDYFGAVNLKFRNWFVWNCSFEIAHNFRNSKSNRNFEITLEIQKSFDFCLFPLISSSFYHLSLQLRDRRYKQVTCCRLFVKLQCQITMWRWSLELGLNFTHQKIVGKKKNYPLWTSLNF